MEFTKEDIDFLKKKGLTVQDVDHHLKCLLHGPTLLDILRPASISDGILKLKDAELNSFVNKFEKEKVNYSISKFVPASGAASRMFKSLYESLETGIINEETNYFLKNLHHFVFCARIGEGKNELEIIEFTLNENGLNYGFLPKALIPFHLDDGNEITPLESHLLEAVNYVSDKTGKINVHFTFSPEHIELANELIKKTADLISERYNREVSVKISVQNPVTDTISLDENNHPVRDERNNLVFRPAGHGALLNNLQETEADLIFIRNIDNILPPKRNEENIFYKKVIGGILIDIQQKLFQFLLKIDDSSEKEWNSLFEFCKAYFIDLPGSILERPDSEKIMNYLNRPIRVCGMVKNEGQAGGGPFWIKNKEGIESLQIVESAQFFPEQKKIMNAATHFNPNDMVVSFKNYKGENFNLNEFSDPNTYFISEKSYNGKKIKALELPGLWNGGMGKWITVFVEIPATIFNPVKTINDLLNENHRA